MRRTVEEFTYPSLEDLFPGFKKSGGKGYKEAVGRFDRSVGYVRCTSVQFSASGYATVRQGHNVFECKVEGAKLLHDLRMANVLTGTVYTRPLLRFSLAGAFTGDGKFDPPRCYLMLSGMR